MWEWFVNFLANVLAALQSWTGDWGLAIIVLTFIIRILLTPLMAKSTASTARMSLAQHRADLAPLSLSLCKALGGPAR